MLSVAQRTRKIEQAVSRAYQSRTANKISESERTQSQIVYELGKLHEDRICHTEEQAAFPVVVGLKEEELSNLLKEKIYDRNLFEAMRCSINIIVDDDKSQDTIRNRIHHFLDEPVRFGTESVNGFALKSSVGGQNNHLKKRFGVLVMKAPREPQKSHEMVHEIIIGLEGLNEVRKVCPHFSYVYDSFKCGAPVTDSSKAVREWCLPGSSPVSYAMYENVSDPITFDKVDNAEDMLLNYIQVLFGLRTANKMCGFTHWDLHHQNALLNRYSTQPFYIPEDYDGVKVYIRTNGRIFQAIDYGMSSIRTKDGRYIGILDENGGFKSMGIRYNEENIISDAYKLVCMVMKFTTNESVMLMCRIILGYFYGKADKDTIREIKNNREVYISEEEAVYINTKQWNSRFHIPKEATEGLVFDNLLDYCLTLAETLYPGSILFDKPERVLGCDGICDTIVGNLKEISEISVDVPSAFDLYQNIDNTVHDDFKRKLLSNPRAVLAKEVDNAQKYLTYKPYNTLFNIPDSANHTKKNISILSDDIAGHSENINKLYELIENIKALDHVRSLLGDKAVLFDDLYNRCLEAKNELLRIVNVYKTNISVGMNKLKRYVFGFNNREPTTGEIERVSEEPLFGLYDTYKNVLGPMNKLT